MTEFDFFCLGRTLMNQHGLQDWDLDLDNARRRAGVCKQSTLTISLSRHYVELNGEADITNTILHEIAHALAGPYHGHDGHWKAICRQIGARPIRCYDHTQVTMPQGRWQATCGNCQQKFCRHKRPNPLRRRWCKACGQDRGLRAFQMVTE